MSAQPSENAAAASVAESVATQPIRALLLDLDDTLIDTRAAMVAAATHAAGELWPELPTDVAGEFGLLHYTDPARNFELYADGVVTFDEMRLARYDHAREVFGVADTDGGVDRFERLYGAQLRAGLTVFADALPLLEAADGRGLPMVLVTNSSAELTEVKLAETGLAGRFCGVITADTFGAGKPDPRVFAAAIEAVGVPAGSVLSVGDNLVRDVLAAVEHGMQGRWLARDGGPHEYWSDPREADPGVCVIASLSEVVTLLD